MTPSSTIEGRHVDRTAPSLPGRGNADAPPVAYRQAGGPQRQTEERVDGADAD